MPRKLKTCADYDAETRHNDYIRHMRQGTKPCVASRRAWALRQREVRARMRKRAAQQEEQSDQ